MRKINLTTRTVGSLVVRSSKSTFLVGMLAATVVASAAATPLTTVRVASGLSSPVAVTHAPGDFDRLFIVEQPGRIRILDITVQPPVLVALRRMVRNKACLGSRFIRIMPSTGCST